MKKNKKWKHRFGDLLGKIEPYCHDLELQGIDDLDDEGFAYLLTHVKAVSIINLNETEITNESIKLLPALEYLKELSPLLSNVSTLAGRCVNYNGFPFDTKTLSTISATLSTSYILCTPVK